MARNQRLDATITIGSVLQRSVGRNLNVIRSGLDSVGAEIKQVTDRQRELSKQRRVLERQGRSVEELDREYEDLGRTLDDLRRKQERYENAQRAANRVGRNFGRMTFEVGRFARTAGIAIGAASAATFGLASSTASLGDEVAKQAGNLGFGIEAYQELRYAAERSGVSIETFDSSMVAFTKRLGEAAQGTGQAGDALDALGLSAEDLIDMEPAAALGLIADRMKGIESPAERAAIASDLFSRRGVRMTNMLGDGSEALAQLRRDAQATGYVLSEEATRDAEAFQDSMLDAKLSVGGLKNIIGAELMPVVTTAMDDFGAFMRDNRDEVEDFAEEFATGLRDALPVIGDVVSGVADVGSTIGTGIARLADFVGGWENFGVVVGGVLASRAILSIGSFVTSVFRLGRAMFMLAPALPWVAGGIRAIGVAMAANPIGAVISAIALGAGFIISKWEDIEPKLRPILDWLGDKFDWTWENLIKPVVDGLKNGVDGIVSAWDDVKAGIDRVMTRIGEIFDTVWQKIKPVVDALRWVRDKGEAAIDAIDLGGEEPGGGGSATAGRGTNDTFMRRGQMMAPPTRRAIGGAFGRGPLLVGERGPELRYESQAGFIAHNRALERMAGLADRIRDTGSQATQQVAQVTQNVTINAAGMSVEQLVDELERRRRQAAQGALFDGAADYGQYGGAHG
jgi:hypothetical protein